MRIVDALTGRTESLVSDTLEQRHAQRERQAAAVAHAIVATREELPRADLTFGPRFIEHLPTRNLYWEFHGDVGYPSDSHHYYVRPDGALVVLQPADPPSRAELERRRARRDERRLKQETAAKERRRQLRAAAR